MADDAGFLSRWSRRKAQARTVADDAAAVVPPVEPSGSTVDSSAPAGTVDPGPAPELPEPADEPTRASVDARPDLSPAAQAPDARAELPTLADVAQLTPEADFSTFVDRAVAPEVRNAAMKKLFADPHFNVMDGLDVYIDDYNKTEPLPRQWLRQMMQARALGLLDDEVNEQPRPDEWAAAPAPAQGEGAARVPDVADVPEGSNSDVVPPPTGDPVVAQAPTPDAAHPGPYHPAAHEDADLPLQRDDAAGPGGADPCAGGEPGRA